MRIYYLFFIRKEFLKITKEKPENLYKILESIYLMKREEIKLGFNVFNKVCLGVDYKNINKLIYDINKHNLSYTCFTNTHLINDFFSNETTKLIVNKSHIKVKSNMHYPSLFNNIKNYPNLFVCDFINGDYFYLNEIQTLSCTK